MIEWIMSCYKGAQSLCAKEKCNIECSINSNCCHNKKIKICESSIPIPTRLHKFILRTRNRSLKKSGSANSMNSEEENDLNADNNANCFHRLITY